MTSFATLDDYVALPRTTALAAARDGSRLVAGVGTLDKDATAWVTNLWEIDPTGRRPARRLTRGEKGESTVAFTPDGDLLFVAKRQGDDDAPPALWLLPAAGGEARVVATHPGGFAAVKVRGSTILLVATLLRGASGIEDDERLRKARKEKKVAAILHDSYPVRFWDHDLGPDHPHLYVADLAALTHAPAGGAEPMLELRDLTPDAGTHLTHAELDLAPDGSFVVTTWAVYEARAEQRTSLVRIDVATFARTTLLSEEGWEFEAPRISPDGTRVAHVATAMSTPERAPEPWLEVLDLASGERTRLLATWDNWPGPTEWLPDGSALVMAADQGGRAPLFRVPLDGSDPVRLTADGAFSDLSVTPAGVFALRSSYAYPAEPVRLALPGGDTAADSADVVTLPAPGPRPALPGTLTEVHATGLDGAPVRSWLALPEGASADSPAPLLLWIHGGPLGSWNAWSWRWNPWLAVARGYAVLLPDPALSTGYGRAFIQRGWGTWGDAPFTDLMAATDAAEARDDVDATRTAAMGGSFGGYMANWVAGHTDRFRAIVTHASLWALDQFGPTTDVSSYWQREMTPEMGEKHSPHRFVGQIRTPMLVIHGDRDYRVPIGEGLRLWYELLSKSGLPAGPEGQSAHRFLYFPNENHWILSPQHAKVWYEVVFAFLAEHVLGEEAPARPELLG
ncbi:MAG: S9 family peptidase [Actinomycetales bacterium]|nr:S9 family peptidase [Actinomycetales bacterium]